MRITNEKGEQLYYITVNCPREATFVDPLIKTWEEAKALVKKFCEPLDNDCRYRKNVQLDIDEEYKRIKAINILNHKGWGDDYIECIKVNALYY